MPVLFDALGELDDAEELEGLGTLHTATPAHVAPEPLVDADAAAEAADAPPATAPSGATKRRTSKGSGGAPARKAVTDALSLLASLGAPTGTGASPAGIGVLPTARVRTALDELAGAGSIEALSATSPDMKRLVKDACDWAGAVVASPKDTGVRGTGAVVKAVGSAITGVDESGESTYHRTVEMISFATACAPLLDADRMTRLIGHAGKVSCSYAPIRYTAELAGNLQLLLRGYQAQRAEQLLVSLWLLAHQGRWWELIGSPVPNRRGRRLAQTEEEKERTDASVARFRAALENPAARIPAQVLLDVIATRSLTYSPPAAQMMHRLIATPQQLSDIAAAANASPDADAHLVVAHIPNLAPDQRPPSPIPAMVSALIDMLGEMADRRDREAISAQLPKKPKEWWELYPKASLRPFPIPAAVLRIDGAVLPGTGGPGQPAQAQVEILRTPHALKLNGDEMGNCTFSLHGKDCESGREVISRVYQNASVYNFSLVQRGGAWVLGEINSRANAGNVPPAITAGVTALAATIA